MHAEPGRPGPRIDMAVESAGLNRAVDCGKAREGYFERAVNIQSPPSRPWQHRRHGWSPEHPAPCCRSKRRPQSDAPV